MRGLKVAFFLYFLKCWQICWCKRFDKYHVCQEGTNSERRARGLVAISGSFPQEGNLSRGSAIVLKKQQLFRLISSFTTGRQLYILKFRHGVRFCPERAVERKGPLVKYGGCDNKSFQIVDLVGRIMTVVACTSM